MKTILKVFVVFALLAAVGCGNKIDSKLDELEKKPAAATIGDAKALYDEVVNFIRWCADEKNGVKMTDEQLARAKTLQKRRFDEGLTLIKNKATSGLSGALSGLGLGGFGWQSIDPSKAIDWFIGVDDPRMEKFAGPATEPTTDRGSKGWK